MRDWGKNDRQDIRLQALINLFREFFILRNIDDSL